MFREIRCRHRFEMSGMRFGLNGVHRSLGLGNPFRWLLHELKFFEFVCVGGGRVEPRWLVCTESASQAKLLT
jgi:hypothetical protein